MAWTVENETQEDYNKRIWNEAIEAAALKLAGDKSLQQIIRNLKK